jgi:peptide/nickel transport system substrate-binding protein
MNWFPATRRGVLAGGASLATLAASGRIIAQEGNHLTVRGKGDIQILDPAFRNIQPEGDVIDSIWLNLIAYKPGSVWEWELSACDELEAVDDTHIRFKLKPGIMWTGDYGEMSAEDVKYSFERFIDPEVGSPYDADFVALDHVEVEDDLTGVIVLKEPYVPFFTLTLAWYSGAVICKKAMEETGTAQITTDPISTNGPFLLKEWKPGQFTILERNPLWTGEPTGYERITIIPIADNKPAELAFQAGEIDFTEVDVTSLPELEANPPENSTLLIKPTVGYTWLGMNVDGPVTSDIKVRQAVQASIDVDQILEAVYFGMTPKSTGFVAPGLPGHREIEMPARDVEKAKALLAEAGYPDGVTLTLDVLNRTDRMTAAQIIQSNLADAGITVEIQPREGGIFWGLGSESAGDDWKNIQLILNGYVSSPDPAAAQMWFTPDQVGKWNWERFNDAEYAELMDESNKEMDPAKRAQMFERMQEIMWESGAYFFITHEVRAAIYRDTLDPATIPNGRVQYRRFKPAAA